MRITTKIVRMFAKERCVYLGISVGKKLNTKGVSHTNPCRGQSTVFIPHSSTVWWAGYTQSYPHELWMKGNPDLWGFGM